VNGYSGPTTTTGLKVKANLDESIYRKAQEVSKEEMDRLNMTRHETCPRWNYALDPRRNVLLERDNANP
jgi:hypothetical protein